MHQREQYRRGIIEDMKLDTAARSRERRFHRSETPAGFQLTERDLRLVALTGAQAALIGLINHAVPAEDLDKAVDEFAHRLAAGASRAIQWTKLSMNIGLKALVTSTLDASIAYEALSNLTKDHQEAVNAFREKRAPRFTGE